MDQYLRWLFRGLSLLAIANTSWLALQWGMDLFRQRLYIFVVLAPLLPVAMLLFLFFVNIRERSGAVYAPLYRRFRAEMLKCFILTVGSTLLESWQK
jgi:hypothetical protein